MVTMAQVPLGYAHDGVIAKFSIFEHFFVKVDNKHNTYFTSLHTKSVGLHGVYR